MGDGGGGAVIFADSNEKGVHRRERKKNWREQTGCVFVMDYFCGVASVCSSCGQWIMLEFMRMSICWSHSAFFLCQSADTDFKLLYSKRGGQCGDSTHISLVTPYTIWQTCRGALSLHEPREKTDTLQQQSAGWDLAAINLLHPSAPCSNPQLWPSAWQSCTHAPASYSLITHVCTQANYCLAHTGVGGLITERAKKAITVDVQAAQRPYAATIAFAITQYIYLGPTHPPSASILQDHNSYDSCMFGPGLVWLHRCTCYSKARVTPFIQTHTHIYMWHTFSAGTCVFSVIAAAHLLTLCTTSCGVDHCWLWFDRWKDLNGQMRVEFQAVNVSITVGKKRSGVQQICLDYFCL